MTATPNHAVPTFSPENIPQEGFPVEGILQLLAVVARLRNPEGGCPWDLKQTHGSLKPYMLEEAYESVEAMALAEQSGNHHLLQEELGDVLLQVALHAQLAKEAKHFDFNAVAQGIAEKLIRRHPHVFANTQVANAEEVTRNWEAIKQAEKAANGTAPKTDSILEGIPLAQPALSRAYQTSRKAVKVGFKWPDLETLWTCVMSEFDEFKQVVEETNISEQEKRQRLEEEMGDILFATVSLCQHFEIAPETALTLATDKFKKRFQTMEHLANQRQQALDTLDFEAWDTLWKQAKKLTHHSNV